MRRGADSRGQHQPERSTGRPGYDFRMLQTGTTIARVERDQISMRAKRQCSSQRGQGGTEYILIIALVVLSILVCAYLFRDSVDSSIKKIGAVLSGKKVESTTSSSGGNESGGDANAAGGGQESAEGAAQAGAGGSEGGGTGEANSAGDGQSAAEGGGSNSSAGEDDSGASVSGKTAVSSDSTVTRCVPGYAWGPDKDGNMDCQPVDDGNNSKLTVWALIILGAILVLIVGYFFTASSR